jgi:hypothetical protein
MIATLVGVCGRNANEWREATAEIETSLNYGHVPVRVFKQKMSGSYKRSVLQGTSKNWSSKRCDSLTLTRSTASLMIRSRLNLRQCGLRDEMQGASQEPIHGTRIQVEL